MPCCTISIILVALFYCLHNYFMVSAYINIQACGVSGIPLHKLGKVGAAEKCEFPWMVAVKAGPFNCPGYLINERTVVTTASCFIFIKTKDGVDPFKVSVFVPPSNNGTAAVYRSRKIILHPDYKRLIYSYNVAIVVLDERVFFSECLRPICLPEPDQQIAGGCIYLKWNGTVKHEPPMSLQIPHLKDYDSTPVDMTKYIFNSFPKEIICRTRLRKMFSEQALCAGTTPTKLGRINPSGPLMCRANGRYIIFGISGFGNLDRGQGTTMAFLKASHPPILQFIKNHADLCGLSEVPSRRIVGGTYAEECEFPWMVKLQIYKSMCGGTIIDEWNVLTSAHCVVNDDTGKVMDFTYVWIRGGSINDRKLHPYHVRSIRIHHLYKSDQSYDIALVTLVFPLLFTRCQSPICLPKEGQELPAQCFVAGWGDLDATNNNYQVDILRKVTLPIQEHTKCHEYYDPANKDRFICAGGHNKSTCSGDSGGPFMCKVNNTYVLFGVIDSSIECGKTGEPALIAKLSHPSLLRFVDDSIINFDETMAEKGFWSFKQG